jgi:hypothetical protein
LTVSFGLGCRRSDINATETLTARRVALPVGVWHIGLVPSYLQADWITALDVFRTADLIDVADLARRLEAAGTP